METTLIKLNNEYIIGKPMNDWITIAKSEPIPKMLFSELWHEGEVCILFSSTGLGKSVLAMQIADSITRGINIPHFKMEAEKQRVLYFDFEFSGKQLQKRYSKNFEDDYIFDDNFIRVKIEGCNANINESNSYDNYLISEIEKYIVKSTIKIVVIDNITYLKGAVEKAHDALPFMKKLNDLKNMHGLSILVLAHSNKAGMASLHFLTINDLSGSSAISQFCDSCFAIGKSTKEVKTRYIKQIKQRYTENVYGEDNIIVCILDKPDNRLYFSFTSFGREYEHIQNMSDNERANSISIANNLRSEGKSYRDIAKEFGVSHTTIENWLKIDNTLKQ